MPRKLHLAVAVYGVGGPGQHGLWKDPRVPKNASVDINYYIRLAQIAEQALFDAMFIVDSQFINASYPSHYLNRLEPLTRLSAVATHTSHIGLVGTARLTDAQHRGIAGAVPGRDRPGRAPRHSRSPCPGGPVGLSAVASGPAHRLLKSGNGRPGSRP